MTEQDLKTTLLKAQSGDSTAFGALYDHFAGRLYKFIYFRVGHKEVAEDILSDTFVKAWQKINQINSPAALSGWLYQIVKNNIIDYYRLKKETVALEDIPEFLDAAVSTIEILDLDLSQKKILEILHLLPKDQELVIRYRFFEDLASEEIAYIMDKTEGAVRVIQHRAILKLKELLDKK